MHTRRGRSSLRSEVERPPSARAAKAGLALVAVVAALSGAGASCSSGANECLSTRTYFEQNVWSAFMGQTCGKCHTPDGTAVADHSAKFVLQPSSYPGFVDANLDMIKTISKIEYEGQSELLLKPIGEMGHIGGTVITKGSDQYNALVELVNRVKNDSSSCTPGPNDTLAGVQTASAESTLRRAAIDLVGRLPTAAEKASVKAGGDAALGKALDGMMKEEAFYGRAREIFNDVLLTDKYLSYGGAAINVMNSDQQFYPWLDPYKDSNDPHYDAPERPLINKALAREPLDLIVYVLKNGKPFTDVVAANYTVVNPYTAIAYGLDKTIQFKDPTDYDEFHETTVTLGGGALVPHAGVLSTPAFLNRWQTSPTNRNRGRARRVLSFFLATDVLKIAERPVDATKVTAEENPTRNSTLCTVCHKIIDPIAGGFRGFDDNDYEAFDPPNNPWHDEMFSPGFGGQDMDPGYYDKALQWLGPKVAGDPRFNISAVHTVYKGLTGHDPLPYPVDSADPDFTTKLKAWEAQDDFFRSTADAFVKGNHDLKLVFKAVVESVYYRGEAVTDDTEPGVLEDVGLGRLLTPEMLNRKITAVTGVHWRKNYDWANQHDWLTEDYDILYGGIDSDSTITRLTAANGLIASVASRMSNEMACSITAWDFTKSKGSRLYFPSVDLTEAPELAGHTVDGSVASIKKNIQYLHELFLGEELALDDPEIERTYQLFLDTWHELSQSGDTGLNWGCSGRWDPRDGTDLPDAVQIGDDKNFTLRSWMAVMTYLMSDYKFLYE